MRADRLLGLVLLLQDGRRARARELARRLGVTERTIYRDVDSLSGAGVPVYAQRGPGGGVALLGEWRTRLSGLSDAEVQALATVGAPRALADIGLSGSLRSSLAKLAATLDEVQRRAGERARERLHIDASGWYQGEEQVPHLGVLREAVWADRRLRMTYRDFNGRVATSLVDPYGLVIKVERWYLVAGTTRGPAVFRGSRVEAVEMLGETFSRPRGFDLADFWTEWCRAFARERPRYSVQLRLTAEGEERLRRVRPEADGRLMKRSRRGGNGIKTVTLDFERPSIALAQLVLLAPGVEVAAPEDLRQRLREAGRAVIAGYDERSSGRERRRRARSRWAMERAER